MEKLIFDSGIKEYELGAGVLRFNPSDPNVYARFLDAIQEIQDIEKDLVSRGQSMVATGMDKAMESTGDTAQVLGLMREADRKVKEQLNAVFLGNDFDALLESVNLMAVAGNRERVVTNLLDALTPIIEDGVKKFTDSAVNEAKANRAQRRAAQKGQA